MQAPDLTLHNRYRVIYAINERPDSRMYRSRDDQTSQTVLIAELPVADDAERQELERLARQIAAIQHDMLLPLMDHFSEGPAYYLVCAEPPGQDMERALRAHGGPMAEVEALAQADRFLALLDYLHNQKPALLLGDPTPQDVWITETGDWAVLPFVLARSIGKEPSPYRAPELVSNDAEPTRMTDLYAVGALIYHGLTGWAPPTSEQQRAGIPLNAPRTLNPAVSALAEQALLRSLQLRSNNRYQTASEMRIAFETVQIMGGRSLGLGPDVLVTADQLPANIQPEPVIDAGRPETPPPPQPAAPIGYAVPPMPYPSMYPPQQPKQGISTGCLVGIAIAVSLLATVICGALLLFLPGSPIRTLPGIQGASPSVTPASANTAPTPVITQETAAPTAQPTLPPADSTPMPTLESISLGPNAITANNASTITQTHTITTPIFGPVAYAPDGKLLAVGVGNTVNLRDGSSLEDRGQLEGHTGRITSLVWSPDSRLLATGASDDNSIRIWDATGSKLLLTLQGHSDWIRSLTFAPDAKTLASGSADMTIKLWDASTGANLQTLSGHTEMVGGVAFTPDGKQLASGSRDGSVRLWDVTTGQPISGFNFLTAIDPDSGSRYWTTGVVFSPDGKTLVIGSTDTLAYLVDASTGVVQKQLKGHTGWIVIRGLVFTPDGKAVITAGLDGTIRVWDPATGQETGQFEGHRLDVFSISITGDGTRLVSASDQEGQLFIWDVASRQASEVLRVGQGLIQSMIYSPDSSVLATVGYNGVLQLNLIGQKRSRFISGSAISSQPLAFLSDGRVAGISDQQAISIFSTDRNVPLNGLDGTPLSIAASPDGALVAAGSSNGMIALWDGTTGQFKTSLRSNLRAVSLIAFSHDGSLLAMTGPSDAPQIEVWDISAGKRQSILNGPGGTITGIAFQPRGKLLAAASIDGTVRLWQAQDGEAVRTIGVSSGGYTAGPSFSPDGTMIATGTANGEIQIWNAGTGVDIARIRLPDAGVTSITFSPDGQQLAIGARDGSVRIYEIRKQ